MYNLFEPVHYMQCPVLQVLLPMLPVHSKRIAFVSVSSFLLVDKNKHKRTSYMLLIVFAKVAWNRTTFSSLDINHLFC